MKSKDRKVCIVFDATNCENTETARLLLENEYPDADLLDLSSHKNHPSGPRHENYKIFSIRDIRSRPHSGRQVPAYGESLRILDHFLDSEYDVIVWLTHFHLAFAIIQVLKTDPKLIRFDLDFRVSQINLLSWNKYSNVKLAEFRNFLILQYMESAVVDFSQIKKSNLGIPLQDFSGEIHESKVSSGYLDKSRGVSIVVAHYQLGKYLMQALDSIQNQNHSNFECIVIDDGSNEANLKLFRDCKAKYGEDGRFKFIEKQNEDVGKTRNFGAALAKNDLLAFVDADDMISTDYLDRYVEAFNQGAKIVTSHLLAFTEGNNLATAKATHWDSFEPLGGVKNSLWYNNFVGGANLAIYKDLFVSLGGFDETKKICHHDWLFLTKATLLNCDIRVIPFPIYYYRTRRDSMLHTRSDRELDLKIAEVYASAPMESMQEFMRSLMLLNVFGGLVDDNPSLFRSPLIQFIIRLNVLNGRYPRLTHVIKKVFVKYVR